MASFLFYLLLSLVVLILQFFSYRDRIIKNKLLARNIQKECALKNHIIGLDVCINKLKRKNKNIRKVNLIILQKSKNKKNEIKKLHLCLKKLRSSIQTLKTKNEFEIV